MITMHHANARRCFHQARRYGFRVNPQSTRGPGDQWFGVHRDHYILNPFITQRFDEGMHLVSDNEPGLLTPRCRFRRFLGKRVLHRWLLECLLGRRYATLLIDDSLPVPPSLSAPAAMQLSREVPMRYYVIWVGTTLSNGAVFTDYITTDQSVNRALRSDLLSIGARFDSFDEAITYARLDFADVPPFRDVPRAATRTGGQQPLAELPTIPRTRVQHL